MDLSQWEIIERNYDDLRFGPIDIYLNQQDQQQLLMVKNILCTSDEMFSNLYLRYQKLYRDKPKNVLNLNLIKADKETKVIILYFPYPNFDLYDRQDILQNSEEIFKFIYESINALSYYEKNNWEHYNIKPEYFYYQASIQQYILLPTFNFKQTYYQYLQQQVDDNQIIFWPPEIIRNFKTQDNDYNIHKQNLFSIGIIVLSLLIEINVVQQIYDIQNFKFNKDLFNNIKLVIDSQNFKEEKFEFLSEVLFDEILELDSNKRITPLNCLQVLQNLKNETDVYENKIQSQFQSQKNLDKPKMIGSQTIQDEEEHRPKTQQKKRDSRNPFQMSFGNLMPNNNLHSSNKNNLNTDNISNTSPYNNKTETQSNLQTIKQKTSENWPYQIDSKPDNTSSQFSFDFENNTQKFSENQDFIDKMMEEHKSEGKTSWFEKSNENVDSKIKLQFNEDIAKQIDGNNNQQEDNQQEDNSQEDDKELFETAGFDKSENKQKFNSGSKVDETFDSIISSKQNENTIISIKEEDKDSHKNLDQKKMKNQFTKKNLKQNIEVIEYKNQESENNIVFDVTPDNEQQENQKQQLFNMESEELNFKSLQQKNYEENFENFYKEILISINLNSFKKFLIKNKKLQQDVLEIWILNEDKLKSNMNKFLQQLQIDKQLDLKEVKKILQQSINIICDIQPRQTSIELFFQEMIKFCIGKYITIQQNFSSLNYSEQFDKKRQSVQNYYFMQSGHTSKFNSQRQLQIDTNTQSYFDNEKFTELNMKVNQSNEQLSYPKTSVKREQIDNQIDIINQYQQIEDSKEESFYRSNQKIFQQENSKVYNFAQKLKNSRKNLNQDPNQVFPNIYNDNKQFQSERQIRAEKDYLLKLNQSEQIINHDIKQQNKNEQEEQINDEEYEQELKDSFKQFENLPLQYDIKGEIKPFQSEQKVIQEKKENQRIQKRTFKLDKGTYTDQSIQEQTKSDLFLQFVQFLNQNQFNFKMNNYLDKNNLDSDKFFVDFIDQLNSKKSQHYDIEKQKNYFNKQKIQINQNLTQKKTLILASNFGQIFQFSNKIKNKNNQLNRQKQIIFQQKFIQLDNDIQQQDYNSKPLLKLQNIEKILNFNNFQNDDQSENDSKIQTIKFNIKPSFSSYIAIQRYKQLHQKQQIRSKNYVMIYKPKLQKIPKQITNNQQQNIDIINRSIDSQISYKTPQLEKSREYTPDLKPKKFMNTQEFNLQTQSNNFMYSQDLTSNLQQLQSIQKLSTILKNNQNFERKQQNKRGQQKRQIRLSTRSVDINLKNKNETNIYARQSQYRVRDQPRRFGSKSPVRIIKYTEQQFKSLNKEHQKQFKTYTRRPDVSVDRNKVYQEMNKITQVKRPMNSPLPSKQKQFSITQYIESQGKNYLPLEQSFQQKKIIQIQSEKFNNQKSLFFEPIQKEKFQNSNKKNRANVSIRPDLPLKKDKFYKQVETKMNKRKNQRWSL